MTQITHDNHFVPQLYLKQWSEDGKRIWAYRLLASNRRVPLWELRSIRGIGFQRDLYTEYVNGQEVDEFEKWMESEYEMPAQDALNKVIHDKPLTTVDWERLALFLAAQDVRTPTSYLESKTRWENTLPNLLENTLKASVNEIEAHMAKGETIKNIDADSSQTFRKALKIQITPDSESRGSFISAEITVGRALWLDSQRLLLTKTAKALLNHKWSIVEPAAGNEWFTSDHPVIKLNYYKDNTHDLKGGWGNPKTDLIMPLSPRHLLFTEIGVDAPDRFSFSREKTIEIQSFLAEKASRWIYARQRTRKIVQLRPREVDLKAFREEEEQLKKWHQEQSDVEKRQ